MDELKLPDEIVQFLINDPLVSSEAVGWDTRTVDGDTILQRLIQRKSFSLALQLIDMGVNVHERGDMGNTALHYAAEKENFDRRFFAHLLAVGGNLQVKNDFGLDVMEWAKSSGNDFVVALIPKE